MTEVVLSCNDDMSPSIPSAPPIIEVVVDATTGRRGHLLQAPWSATGRRGGRRDRTPDSLGMQMVSIRKPLSRHDDTSHDGSPSAGLLLLPARKAAVNCGDDTSLVLCAAKVARSSRRTP